VIVPCGADHPYGADRVPMKRSPCVLTTSVECRRVEILRCTRRCIGCTLGARFGYIGQGRRLEGPCLVGSGTNCRRVANGTLYFLMYTAIVDGIMPAHSAAAVNSDEKEPWGAWLPFGQCR
jgi:hypothetical protein